MLEVLYGEVYDLVMYISVTCDDDTYVAAAERVTHIKVMDSTVTFILKLGGVNVITSTLKWRNYVAASNVPVTAVPHTLIH